MMGDNSLVFRRPESHRRGSPNKPFFWLIADGSLDFPGGGLSGFPRRSSQGNPLVTDHPRRLILENTQCPWLTNAGLWRRLEQGLVPNPPHGPLPPIQAHRPCLLTSVAIRTGPQGCGLLPSDDSTGPSLERAPLVTSVQSDDLAGGASMSRRQV